MWHQCNIHNLVLLLYIHYMYTSNSTGILTSTLFLSFCVIAAASNLYITTLVIWRTQLKLTVICRAIVYNLFLNTVFCLLCEMWNHITIFSGCCKLSLWLYCSLIKKKKSSSAVLFSQCCMFKSYRHLSSVCCNTNAQQTPCPVKGTTSLTTHHQIISSNTD